MAEELKIDESPGGKSVVTEQRKRRDKKKEPSDKLSLINDAELVFDLVNEYSNKTRVYEFLIPFWQRENPSK